MQKSCYHNIIVCIFCKTIYLSVSYFFFLFDLKKRINFVYRYLWSGILVLLGIYLNLLSKNHEKFEEKLRFLYYRFYKKKDLQKYESMDSLV